MLFKIIDPEKPDWKSNNDDDDDADDDDNNQLYLK